MIHMSKERIKEVKCVLDYVIVKHHISKQMEHNFKFINQKRRDKNELAIQKIRY